MKIAIVSYTNIIDKTDGMTNFYKKLYQYGVEKRDLQIDFFMQDSDEVSTIVKGNVRFHTIKIIKPVQLRPKAFVSISLLFYAKVISLFYKKFKKEKYDAIQISAAHPFCACALIVAKRLDIPIICSYHTRLPEYAEWTANNRFTSWKGDLISNLLGRFVRLWVKLIYRSCEIVLAPTKSLAEELIREHYTKSVKVVGRGVDSDKFKPMPAKNKKCKLLYVGRFAVEKNLDSLKFLEDYPNLELTMVGDGDLQHTGEVLPFARFTGYLSGTRLYEEFGKADIFVFPSKTDAFANSVLEAMSSGLPVIAYRNAGLEDKIRHGVNGFLVSTPQDFLKAILLLEENPDLRKKMSAQARKFALQFTWSRSMEQQVAAFHLAKNQYIDELRMFFPTLRRVMYSFNVSHAFLGALKMCFYVFLANISAGIAEGLNAGFRQALLSFFMIGINTSFYEVLSYRNRPASILLPSLLTSTVALTVHWLSGTPNLFATWLLILLLALFNFFVLSFLHVRHKTISPWELIRIYSSAAFQIFRYLRSYV